MGRPTKITPARQRRVVEALLAGGSHESAARLGGVTPSTHYAWCDRGRKAISRARASKTETISAAAPNESRADAAERIARDVAKIVAEADRPFAEYSEAVESALALWELGMVAVIQRAAQGQPYEKRRAKYKDEVTGTRADGTPVVTRLLVEEVVETGTTNRHEAALSLLRVRMPAVYNETLRLAHSLDPEQTGLLIAKAVEGILAELGVDRKRKGVGEIVHRHLTLVADEAEAS